MAQLIRRIHTRFHRATRQHGALQTWDGQVGGRGRLEQVTEGSPPQTPHYTSTLVCIHTDTRTHIMPCTNCPPPTEILGIKTFKETISQCGSHVSPSL